MTDDDVLSVGQAARECGVSSQSVRRWIEEGKLPARRTPLGFLVGRGDVEALVALRERARLGQMRHD